MGYFGVLLFLSSVKGNWVVFSSFLWIWLLGVSIFWQNRMEMSVLKGMDILWLSQCIRSSDFFLLFLAFSFSFDKWVFRVFDVPIICKGKLGCFSSSLWIWLLGVWVFLSFGGIEWKWVFWGEWIFWLLCILENWCSYHLQGNLEWDICVERNCSICRWSLGCKLCATCPLAATHPVKVMGVWESVWVGVLNVGKHIAASDMLFY